MRIDHFIFWRRSKRIFYGKLARFLNSMAFKIRPGYFQMVSISSVDWRLVEYLSNISSNSMYANVWIQNESCQLTTSLIVLQVQFKPLNKRKLMKIFKENTQVATAMYKCVLHFKIIFIWNEFYIKILRKLFLQHYIRSFCTYSRNFPKHIIIYVSNFKGRWFPWPAVSIDTISNFCGEPWSA